MSKNRPEKQIVPAGFFAFRTPLLPLEELDALSAGLEAPGVLGDADQLAAALDADRRTLRERIRALIARPEIHEALFVASPSLMDGLSNWLEKPDSKKGRRAEEALVRYIQRMMTRATPFGLFSGCSVGLIDGETRLSLQARASYERHTRLDMDYLFALAEDMSHEPVIRRRLRYRPNSSLYQTAGRWRYAEARLVGRVRSHHLVAIETEEFLGKALEVARGGATVAELAQALVDYDADGEVTFEEAEEFIFEMISSQILVSDLAPAVTGPEPIHDLIAQVAQLPEARGVGERLDEVRRTLDGLDAGGVGQDPETYRGVARRLEDLPTRVELPRLFQVDMIKPADGATLGPQVIAEIERTVDMLWRLSGPRRDDALTQFSQDFTGRYEDAIVPLVEVLDEEVGIGFDRARGSDASPLLDGLNFPARPGTQQVAWSSWTDLVMRKVEDALRHDRREIEITDKDLEPFSREGLPPLPDGFQVMASLAAAAPEDVENGDFTLAFRSASGPSGAQLLGRFCHADPVLMERVSAFLRAEEELGGDAIFAEVVHLPEGRIGNVLLRPVMREYEIPFLGRSGCDSEHQIPVDDILVTVRRQEIQLFSRRLKRRIIPRLTSAHNFSSRSLGIYRFLCTLQSQHVRGSFFWQWGPFENLSFLPRVRSGRTVLSRARWLVRRDEIDHLLKDADATARYRAVRAWQEERALPDKVLLVDADNELLLDFDSILSVESLLALLKNRPSAVLNEFYPEPPQQSTTGPEGRFVTELVVPFLYRGPAPHPSPQPGAPLPKEEGAENPGPARRSPTALQPPAGFRRTFLPGSEWLYAKLYTGTSTADQLLCDVVGPVAREAVASGAADSWFFIRYGDPQWHLRVRFHGDPRRLESEVLPRLAELTAPMLDEGRVWKVQYDTYQREVERYGGPNGIDLYERLAHADSEAVLTIVEHLEGDEGAAVRWRLAVRGIDQLVRDMRLDGDAKIQVLQRLQESFANEFQIGTAFKKQLSDRLRGERKELDALLDAPYHEDHPLAPGLAAFDARSHALESVVDELYERFEAGRLTLGVPDMTTSYLHMFVNRLIRSDGRMHEVVLYDFAHRLILSRVARERQKARPKKKKKKKKSS